MIDPIDAHDRALDTTSAIIAGIDPGTARPPHAL